MRCGGLIINVRHRTEDRKKVSDNWFHLPASQPPNLTNAYMHTGVGLIWHKVNQLFHSNSNGGNREWMTFLLTEEIDGY